MKKSWLDKVVVIEKPLPHIPQQELDKIMPPELKDEWEKFIFGQTGLHCDNGDFGVYAWDFERFAGRVRRKEKDLQDSAAEWD